MRFTLPDHFSATISLEISQPQPELGLVQLNATRGASGSFISCDVNRADFLAAVSEVLGVAVIDPEELEQVDRLDETYGAALNSAKPFESTTDAMQAALREYVKPTPPKPEEPTGLGAVAKDRDGHAWVRTHATGYPWHSALDRSDLNSTAARKWEQIDAVEVFTEGWSE